MTAIDTVSEKKKGVLLIGIVSVRVAYVKRLFHSFNAMESLGNIKANEMDAPGKFSKILFWIHLGRGDDGHRHYGNNGSHQYNHVD